MVEGEKSKLKTEINRLLKVEKEARSLRNATTAMGMALETEQQARREVERELQDEQSARRNLEDELLSYREEAALEQQSLAQKKDEAVDRVKLKLDAEKHARQKAEKEL